MAFGKRTPLPDVSIAVAVEDEESFDVLNLTRLTMHPLIEPLMARREALLERKNNLLQGQRQLDAVRQDFEKVHSLALAEEDADTLRRWREVKQQNQDYDDQLQRIEAGLAELDTQIDGDMAAVREQVQAELDALFAPEVEQMIDGLQALVEANAKLHEIERANNRLLQTERLELYNPGLEVWLMRLTRMLALIAPR